MAQTGLGRLVVVSADDPQSPVGIVTRSDLLKPREREMLEEEVRRERFLGDGPLPLPVEESVELRDSTPKTPTGYQMRMTP